MASWSWIAASVGFCHIVALFCGNYKAAYNAKLKQMIDTYKDILLEGAAVKYDKRIHDIESRIGKVSEELPFGSAANVQNRIWAAAL